LRTIKLGLSLCSLLLLVIVGVGCGAAIAAPSRLPMLVEQCLQLQSPLEVIAYKTGQNVSQLIYYEHIATSTQNPVERRSSLNNTAAPHLTENQSDSIIANTYLLEASLQGLFNIKDRLRYYKGFALQPRHRESLLLCQIRLADMLTTTLTSSWVQQLIASMYDNDNEQAQLKLRLARLTDAQIDLDTKSKLHTAQAVMKQGLRNPSLTLEFNQTNCRLPQVSGANNYANADEDKNNDNDTNALSAGKKDIDLTIAAYLIAQSDPKCQQLVWQAYQGRAKAHNQAALAQITQLQQHTAIEKGFDTHTQYALSVGFLSSAPLVSRFLDSQTHTLPAPPWQLGQRLAIAHATPIDATSDKHLLHTLQQKAHTLGFHFENVSDKILRVWYQQRLLGDIYLQAAKRSRAQVLRYPILGYQFGQVQLSTKTELNTLRDKQALNRAFASALASLSATSHYYFVNTIGESLDSSNIGRNWLELYLAEGIIEPPTPDSREALLIAHATQLKVFRAKVALDLYLTDNTKRYASLSHEFSLSFGDQWDGVEDYPYNFYAIADEGPLYYQDVWQVALANYLFESTKICTDQQGIFDTLIINPDSLPLNKRLSILLGWPVNAQSLIKKIQDGLTSTNTPSA